MKQVLLALVLLAVPVAAFTGFEYVKNATAATPSGLGDLSSFKAIISDVQCLLDKGNVPAAQKRITDYEAAWDSGESAIRPLNQTDWGNIDEASDAALTAIRQPKLSTDAVKQTLAALQTVLDDPSKPAP